MVGTLDAEVGSLLDEAVGRATTAADDGARAGTAEGVALVAHTCAPCAHSFGEATRLAPAAQSV